ncbi:uncharacterized protein BJ171DRAFT_566114 [Polychytrium aggregatum]|uniref:uncharacterized protein n=1 Tax=Polychytrium aggregatum TaxID=110093 RepID=UPI0022FEDFE6|nr:uncharacterized protein BJ171DRAFT_566114 [Polychytrium aggregatum]KAI9207311.1 hypothetical protein BJ171DRAFT_566114 [Polychytrium aggregatum]
MSIMESLANASFAGDLSNLCTQLPYLSPCLIQSQVCSNSTYSSGFPLQCDNRGLLMAACQDPDSTNVSGNECASIQVFCQANPGLNVCLGAIANLPKSVDTRIYIQLICMDHSTLTGCSECTVSQGYGYDSTTSYKMHCASLSAYANLCRQVPDDIYCSGGSDKITWQKFCQSNNMPPFC